MGTLNAGYYVTDGGKHCQLRLWGSSGWFHFELDGRPRPLVWQSNHPSAPEARLLQRFTRRAAATVVGTITPALSSATRAQASENARNGLFCIRLTNKIEKFRNSIERACFF